MDSRARKVTEFGVTYVGPAQKSTAKKVSRFVEIRLSSRVEKRVSLTAQDASRYSVQRVRAGVRGTRKAEDVRLSRKDDSTSQTPFTCHG